MKRNDAPVQIGGEDLPQHRQAAGALFLLVQYYYWRAAAAKQSQTQAQRRGHLGLFCTTARLLLCKSSSTRLYSISREVEPNAMLTAAGQDGIQKLPKNIHRPFSPSSWR